jgi:hypothetical protein
MLIELRNVKEAKFASHETTCFEAVVFIDGIEAGKVSNTGQGGCHRYQTLALEQRLTDHAKTLPALTMQDSEETYPQSADSVIDGLLLDSYIEREVRNTLKHSVYIMREDRLLTCRKPKGMTAAQFMNSTGTPEGVALMLKQLKADRYVTDVAEIVRLMKA